MKKYLFAALMFLGSLLIILTMIEIYLQVQEYRHCFAMFSDPYDRSEVDPFLQVRGKYNEKFHVNRDSFRGDPLKSDQDTYKIFTLGGSTTMQWDLPYELSYPARLKQKLRKAYPDVTIQVQNAACDWYTTEHSIIRYLFCLRDYEPHLLIVMHAINDLYRTFTPELWCRPGANFRRDYSHYLGPIVRLERNKPKLLFSNFLLFDKIKSRILGFDRMRTGSFDMTKISRQIPVREFKSLEVFRKNIRLLINAIRWDSTNVILATQPSIYRAGLVKEELSRLWFGPIFCSQNSVYPDVASLEYGMRLFNESIVDVAEELNVPVVDLDASIPKNATYFFDDVHPKAAATAIEAQLFFDKIMSLKLIDNWRSRKTSSHLNATMDMKESNLTRNG